MEHVRSDSQLMTYVEDGRVVMQTREHLIHRIQAAATAGSPVGESMVDEFIADRRREARAEQQLMEA